MEKEMWVDKEIKKKYSKHTDKLGNIKGAI